MFGRKFLRIVSTSVKASAPVMRAIAPRATHELNAFGVLVVKP
jgi:hypothetical protein